MCRNSVFSSSSLVSVGGLCQGEYGGLCYRRNEEESVTARDQMFWYEKRSSTSPSSGKREVVVPLWVTKTWPPFLDFMILLLMDDFHFLNLVGEVCCRVGNQK